MSNFNLIKNEFTLIGEILCWKENSSYFLCNEKDKNNIKNINKIYTDYLYAEELVKYDDDNEYRPMRYKNNLKTNWLLQLSSKVEMENALDIFYPNCFQTFDRNNIIINLPTTLSRQKGMYKSLQNTTEKQRKNVCQNLCKMSCVKQFVWNIKETDENIKYSYNNTVICFEACSFYLSSLNCKNKRQ